jgi:L-ribulose-5-phosphate 3-epimerase
MQLGTALYTYLWECPLYEAIERATAFGFQTLELPTSPPLLWPAHFGPYERRKLRRHLRDTGIRIFSLNPTFLDFNPVSPNPGIRGASVKEIEDNLQLAADIAADVVVLSAGRRHPLAPARFEDTEALALDIFGECAEVAGELGIVMGLENLATNFITTARQLVDFTSKLSSPWCRIVFDVANAQMLEDPISGLSTAAPYLELVHFADTRRDNWGHLPVGTGEVDFARTMDTLHEIDYAGPVILETIYPDDPDGSIRSSLTELNKVGLTV